MLIFIFANTVAFLYVRYTKPVFRAAAILKLEFKGAARDLGLGIFQNDNEIQNYLIGELAFLSSRRIAERVMDTLHLEVGYFVQGRINDDEKYPTKPFLVANIDNTHPAIMDTPIFLRTTKSPQSYLLQYFWQEQEYEQKGNFGELITLASGTTFVIKKVNEEELPSLNYYFVLNSPDYLVKYLQKNLSATILNPNAQTIEVAFTDPNPYKASAIVDVVNAVYLAETILDKNRKYKQTRDYLDKQLIASQDSLEAYEKRINEHRRNAGLLEPIQNREQIVSQVMQRIEQLIRERAKLLNAQRIYLQIQQKLDEDSINYVLLQSLVQLNENTTLLNAIKEQEKKQKAMDRLLNIYTKATSAYQELERQQLETQRTVHELLQIAVSEIENEIYLKSNEIQQERGRIPDITTTTTDLELKRLQRYLNRYAMFADLTLEKIVNNNILEAGTVPDFKVLSKASFSTTPIFPKPAQIYLYGLATSLFLCIVLIAARYLLQNKITNLREMERLTRAPILGVVPMYQKEKMSVSQLVIDRSAKSPISEAFRSIRTNLEFISFSGEQRTLSVTSTISGEGKTFVAINLGGIIAQSGLRVLILDLDMRKPKIHRAFGVESSPGMSTLLMGKHSIDECVRATKLDNLFFIPAGTIPPNPSELLMSSQFDALFEQLKANYQVIILDTPPVGLVTDGELMMRRADIPLYIVRLNRSLRGYAQEINYLYEQKQIRKLSVILNGADNRRAYGYGTTYGGYQGYGYGYGYGYYDQDEKEGKWLSRVLKKLKK